MKLLLVASAATLLLSTAAMAQTPAPAQAPAAAATATVTDAELTKFARASDDAKGIMAAHQAAIAGAADAKAKAKAESDMSGELQAAVLDNGFTVQRYNEIASAMQTDRALFTRLYQLQNPQPASTPEASSASSNQ